MAKKPEVKLEATPETWSPEDLAVWTLGIGRVRGQIDLLKATVDRIHRARKCPDGMFVAQKAEVLADVVDAAAVAAKLHEMLKAM